MSNVALGPDRIDMTTPAAKAAAAIITDEILADAEESGLQGAAEKRAQLRGEDPEAAAAAPAAPVAPAAEQAEEDVAEAEAFVYESRAPAELDAELDVPDFEAEAAAEVGQPVTDEDEFQEGYEDERLIAERRARVAAEKRLQYIEGLRVQDSKKAWRAEAAEFYPLSEHALDGITATSRKAYLREARAAHQAVEPYIRRYIEQAKGVVTAERQTATTEAREDVQRAWGRPTTGPGVAPVEQAERAAKIEKARPFGLEATFKTMLEEGVEL